MNDLWQQSLMALTLSVQPMIITFVPMYVYDFVFTWLEYKKTPHILQLQWEMRNIEDTNLLVQSFEIIHSDFIDPRYYLIFSPYLQLGFSFGIFNETALLKCGFKFLILQGEAMNGISITD